jgi:hypothetical protein
MGRVFTQNLLRILRFIMKCSFYRSRINWVEKAVDKGRPPYFYDLDQEYELACPACSDALLQMGEDGEMEVREEYRGKLRYLAEKNPEPPQEHLAIGIAILENEPGKLN